MIYHAIVVYSRLCHGMLFCMISYCIMIWYIITSYHMTKCKQLAECHPSVYPEAAETGCDGDVIASTSYPVEYVTQNLA